MTWEHGKKMMGRGLTSGEIVLEPYTLCIHKTCSISFLKNKNSSRRTAYSYRRNFIETAGGLSHVFANKVFCGWDFGIVSQHTAALTANSIYNEFKVSNLAMS